MQNSLQDFENLFRRYRPGLIHFAMNILKSRPDAEEIVQEMFMAIWEKRENLEFNDGLKSYLFTGVKNRCLNFIKKSKLPFSDMPDELPVPSKDASASEHMESIETEKKVHDLINQLPTKCRQVFLLSRMHEMSYKEIADIMDIAPKTVENQIGIALKFLKNGLQ